MLMRNLEDRLKKLERKIIGAGCNNIVVLFINVGETEEEVKAQYLLENPGVKLEGNSNLIIVKFV